MTLPDLQTIYKRLYRTLQKGRFMRDQVFAKDPTRRTAKIAEIDQALADITVLKDELKRHLAQPTQAALIDIPVRRKFV